MDSCHRPLAEVYPERLPCRQSKGRNDGKSRMTPHALTFPVIMIAVGLWQFRRAGRMARINAELDAASREDRQAWEAQGYPPTHPARVRLIGTLRIQVVAVR